MSVSRVAQSCGKGVHGHTGGWSCATGVKSGINTLHFRIFHGSSIVNSKVMDPCGSSGVEDGGLRDEEESWRELENGGGKGETDAGKTARACVEDSHTLLVRFHFIPESRYIYIYIS